MKRNTSPALERVALRLAAILGEDAVLVGAMAVGAHGYVRATKDVDFVVEGSLAEVCKRLNEEGISAKLHRGRSRKPAKARSSEKARRRDAAEGVRGI